MKAIIWRCQIVKTMMNHQPETKYVYEDIRPWVLKLETMAKEVKARVDGEPTDAIDYESSPGFQFPVLSGMGAEISLSMKTAEPAAEVLMPFLLWLREQ